MLLKIAFFVLGYKEILTNGHAARPLMELTGQVSIPVDRYLSGLKKIGLLSKI